MKKKIKVLYWALTILFLVPTAGTAIPELLGDAPANVAQAMQSLGYPPYLLRILGFAKILGALAILFGRFPRLKEWAYAGFTFLLLGATASHLLAHDYAHAPFPFTFFVLQLASYYFWRKTSQSQN
ncbi:MAG TPA: DoxX family protein [bacterium]|nr:DoxX family protein [bacterium]